MEFHSYNNFSLASCSSVELSNSTANLKINCPVAIYKSPLHGDGVESMNPDTITPEIEIYKEKPLHFMQTISNRHHALVCSNCSKFIGSLGIQMRYLQKAISRVDLTESSEDILASTPEYQSLSDIISCCHKCGELYCSEICRDFHYHHKGHRLMCTGLLQEDIAEEHPIYQFKIFAISTNEIFVMVGDIFAEICALYDRANLSEVKNYLTQYDSFVRNLWWDVACTSIKGKNAKAKMKKTLQSLVKEAFMLLFQALELDRRGLADLLNEEFIARLIGMFEQNNLGVRLENPILAYIRQVTSVSEEQANTQELIKSLEFEIERVIEAMDDMGGSGEACMDENCNWEDASEELGDDDIEEESIGDKEMDEDVDEVVMEDSSLVVHPLLRRLEEEGSNNVFPPLDGTAFYQMTCKINHSCSPNVAVTYISDSEMGLMAKISAVKSLSPKEELVQSYIDQTLSTEQRQAALLDYGFRCSCSLCIEGL